MQKPYKFVVALLFAMSPLFAIAEQGKSATLASAPFVNTISNFSEEKTNIAEYAKSALKAGMPSLAKSVIKDNIKKLPALEKSEKINAILADAHIALGEFKEAFEIIETSLKNDNSIENKIRKSIVVCGLNRGHLAKANLEKINPEEVSENLRTWLYLAQGYVAFEAGENLQAIELFTKAKKCAVSSLTAADAETAIVIAKLSAPTSVQNLDKLSAELQQRLNTFIGTPHGFVIAKQYASVLFRLGKEQEALDVINQQLEIELAPDIDKDELLLVSAAMTKDSDKQIATLKEILKRTSSNNIAEFAIELISSNKSQSVENQKDFFEKIITTNTAKVKDRILLEQAKIAVKLNNRTDATKSAQQIIDEFPNSPYKADAYRILAWSSFEEADSKRPQYRLAASHLLNLAQLQNNNAETKYLAATCYFFDKDFANATAIYEEIFDILAQKRATILDKLVETYLLQNDEQKAQKIIEKAHLANIGEDEIWNAEWKLISYLDKNNKTQLAIKRIDEAIESATKTSVLFKIRMMWLRATFSAKTNEYTNTIKYCDNIVDTANAESFENPKFAREIAASALLLKATTLEKTGDVVDSKKSIETYEQIRANYPETEASPLSYLYQARSEAALMHFQKAQELCIELAEQTKNEQIKYNATFDAAEYARKIATNKSYQTALSILDKLCADFPNNPRNFNARINQAEILRLVNSFADARKLYDDIINKFGNHPEIYLAWLGLGDCILALGNQNSDAVATFERLYSLPEMPIEIKAEAAEKWAFALEKSEKISEADEVRWSTSNALISKVKENYKARYWIARNLYNLAISLEQRQLKRDAQAVHELIVKYNLPTAKISKQKLNVKNKK